MEQARVYVVSMPSGADSLVVDTHHSERVLRRVERRSDSDDARDRRIHFGSIVCSIQSLIGSLHFNLGSAEPPILP